MNGGDRNIQERPKHISISTMNDMPCMFRESEELFELNMDYWDCRLT